MWVTIDLLTANIVWSFQITDNDGGQKAHSRSSIVKQKTHSQACSVAGRLGLQGV
jgi:hypothetical protein